MFGDPTLNDLEQRAMRDNPNVRAAAQRLVQAQAQLGVVRAGQLPTVNLQAGVSNQRPSAETGEALAAALDHLNGVVQPHLDDEEQKVVPLAAVTLTQQEWDAMGKRGMSSIPRNKRAIAAGMMLEPLDAADRAYMMKHVPAPMRMLFPFMIERPWKKYASTLRTGT